MGSMGLRTHCPARQRDCQADIPSLPLAAFCYFCCILSESILAQLSMNSNEASSLGHSLTVSLYPSVSDVWNVWNEDCIHSSTQILGCCDRLIGFLSADGGIGIVAPGLPCGHSWPVADLEMDH